MTLDEDKLDEYAQIAKDLVDESIQRATRFLSQQPCSSTDLPQLISESDINDPAPIKDSQPNILWPSCEEFNVQLGHERLLEFITTWQRDESWLYHISLIGKDDLELDTRYRYKVIWSIPTRRKPIPRATASVYFTIEVSRIKQPSITPVKVYYVFESNRLVHRPGHSRFQEQWLKDIIANKVMMFELIDF